MKNLVLLIALMAASTAAVGQDYCADNPDAFSCVPDQQKIQLNRDHINKTTNVNRQRVFSLERAADELGGGVAAAMAMGTHHFDPSNNGLQGSVAVAGFEGNSAASISIGAKINDWSFLSVSGARGSHGVSAVSASFTWGFK